MLHLVKTINLIRGPTPLLCGLVFAVILVLCPLGVAGQQCKEGICLYRDSRWDAAKKNYVGTIMFSGFPRTKNGLVTNFYQIRGGPFGRTQYEGRGGPFDFRGSGEVSIQACRKRGGIVLGRTTCTGWVTFMVY